MVLSNSRCSTALRQRRFHPSCLTSSVDDADVFLFRADVHGRDLRRAALQAAGAGLARPASFPY